MKTKSLAVFAITFDPKRENEIVAKISEMHGVGCCAIKMDYLDGEGIEKRSGDLIARLCDALRLGIVKLIDARR